MATTVRTLSTFNYNDSLDNEYLYCTNTLTGLDTKLRLSDLTRKVSSSGVGLSILGTVTNTQTTFKNFNTPGARLPLSDTRGSLTLSLVPTQLNLALFDNTTAGFISTVDLTENVGTTILPTANGGTNKSSAYVVGDVLYASATNALAGLAGVATGNALISGGIGAAPSWGKIDLATHTSGTLPVTTGGTGVTSVLSRAVLVGNGASAMSVTGAAAAGQILIGSNSGNPAFANIASTDASVIVTNGANSIDLAARVTKLELADGTDMIVSSGTNTYTAAGMTFTSRRLVTNLTAATKNVVAAESGTVFTLNRAGGIVITLPAAAAGLTYEFHVGTTFSGTFQIDAATSADTLQGAIYMGTGGIGNDSDDNAENHGYASPAAADHQYIADADTKGRHLGTHLKYTAITDAIWLVEGFAITSGAIVTPWT